MGTAGLVCKLPPLDCRLSPWAAPCRRSHISATPCARVRSNSKFQPGLVTSPCNLVAGPCTQRACSHCEAAPWCAPCERGEHGPANARNASVTAQSDYVCLPPGFSPYSAWGAGSAPWLGTVPDSLACQWVLTSCILVCEPGVCFLRLRTPPARGAQLPKHSQAPSRAF